MAPETATASPISETEIHRVLAAERARLLREEGVEEEKVHHFRRPVERPFTAADRPKTTILFGGLTLRHERLCKAAMEGLGYRIEIVQTPDVKSFQLGKEFGNNGQCNPTYFTVGNLVKHLHGLRSKGMPLSDILDQYVFLTAGACGPCRFGMYEAEYRLALRNSGFDGFRVILFQQKGGLSQSDVEAGLAMNMDFFLGILNAMNMGDLLNEVGFQIRPYEANPGETDRVLSEVSSRLESRLREKPRPRLPAWVERRLPRGARKALEYVVKFADQLASDYYTGPLGEARDRLARIPVDYARVRPIVKITGEFWAQTTEGDGNYRMFRFLEGEGAQVLVEPIATWINYMLWQAQQGARDRKGIEGGQAAPPWWRLDRWAGIERRFRSKLVKIRLAEALFKREYGRFCEALGGTAHTLTDQYELQRLGHPYYNSKAQGGEGHLEVAKNIYYSNKDLAHMVLSLKPFGCMPSTQSDGAQSAVVSKYKDMIYLPIETSGEGEVNAHSRVQMALGEARSKARAEFQGVLERTGLTVEAVREFVAKHPDLHLDRALLHIPEIPGIVGTGARFVRHVAELMGRA